MKAGKTFRLHRYYWIRRAVLLLAASAGCYTPAAAQEKKPSLLDMPFEELVNVEVSTASRHPEKVAEAPANIYVVTRSDIRSRGYVNLKDVLRDVPGMETIEQYFTEQGTLVPVRGVIGNNKIVVLVNGMRVNPPGGETMSFRSDFSVRNAEQIEISYGPGSTLYGQDAISAVINIITHKPHKKLQGKLIGGIGSEQRKDGYLELGSETSTADGTLIRLNAYAEGIRSDLSDLSKEYPTWWNQNYASIVSATGQLDSPERHDDGRNAFFRAETDTSSFQLWYRDSSRNSAEGGFSPILQFVPEAVWHDRSLVMEAKNNFALSDEAHLESALSYNRYEIDPETRYVYPDNDNKSLFLNDYKYGLGSGLSLDEKLSVTPWDDFRITLGITGSYYDILPKASVPGGADRGGDVVSQAGDLTYYTVPGDPASQIDVPRATDINYDSFAAYAEGNYSISDSVKLVAGGRIDHDSRFEEQPFSPRAAVVYTDAGFTAKYIFSRAFVAPAPYFAYNVFDNSSALNTNNPNLSPEKATSNEVTLAWNQEHWFFSSSFYYNRQENLIAVGDLALPENTIQDEVYLDLAGTVKRRLTQSVNLGSSRSRGADLVLRYSFDWFSLWSSYSIVAYSTSLGESQSGLPGISRHNVRLGVTMMPWERVTITPSFSWRSTPDNIGPAAGLDRELHTPYQLNLHLLYAAFDNVDFFLTALNLTDHHYALRGVLNPAPQEGLTVLGGVRFSF